MSTYFKGEGGSYPSKCFCCIFQWPRVCGFAQFLQSGRVPTVSRVVANSVLEFAPGRMEGSNFRRVFLWKMGPWFQKLITWPFFGIGVSNLVVILFDTFRKNVMIQNFDFLSKFWKKKIQKNFFEKIKKKFIFFFQFFFLKI